MNVDKVRANRAIFLLVSQIARLTDRSVVGDAQPAGLRIPLILRQLSRPDAPLEQKRMGHASIHGSLDGRRQNSERKVAARAGDRCFPSAPFPDVQT